MGGPLLYGLFICGGGRVTYRYTDPASRADAPFLIRWVLLPMIRTVLDNMRETEVWLEDQTGEELQYTVVRPAGLTNNPVTQAEFKVN